MSKIKRLKNLPRILTVILIALSVLAVLFLMRYVQNLLASDVAINLTEVVTQNKDVIESRLSLEVNSLKLAADQIVERTTNVGTSAEQDIEHVFLKYAEEKKEGELFIVGEDGMALFPDGEVLDVSGRNYYRIAIKGNDNISDQVVSRKTGEEVFIISVPVKNGGKVIGTLQKSYSPEEMYRICAVSLFSDQGYMCIINSDGYILIRTDRNEYNSESDNFYRMLYAQGDQQQSEYLERDIKSEKAGFMETGMGGEKTFSAYTPLEGVYDWYLISSIATSAVSPNANVVVAMFYIILLLVVVIFTAFIFYFLHYKNRQQTNLRNIAFLDTVTGGNTYNKFVVDVQEALAEHPQKQYYVLVFDIDNFKYVNSFYGFDRGDMVLRQIVLTLREKLLPGETIARVSGDHFIALLEDASEQRVNKILDAAQKSGEIEVRVSAGLYQITDDEESVNLMMDKARMAAETVKGTSHRRLEVYSADFDTRMIHNEQLKRSLDQAIANGDIVPFYQPKVDVNTQKLVGAEALARWKTKEGLLVSPGEFIPIAEKTGLITDIDMAIFEQVLQFLKRNLDAGVYCVPISVNFSRLHLADTGFVEKLLAKIVEYGVPTQLVELELTESIFLDNYRQITEWINQLHEHGFLTSIDDFGSGYSSLNMLKDIPVDIIKIDRGFLMDSTNSEKQRIIFGTIAEMAERLHIDVVVEGVENEKGIRLMKEFRCFVAQGFYFAKPMEEKNFEIIYEEGRIS